MKKLPHCLAIFVIIINIIIIVSIRKKNYNNDADISQVLAEGNWENGICTIEVSCSFGSIYFTNDEKIRILGNLLAAMGVREIPQWNTVIDGDRTVVSMEKQTDSYEFELQFVTTGHSRGNNVIYLEQDMMVRLSISNSVESMLYYGKIIEDYMESYGNEANSRMEFSCGPDRPESGLRKE